MYQQITGPVGGRWTWVHGSSIHKATMMPPRPRLRESAPRAVQTVAMKVSGGPPA
jgi:hypothetical protein